MEERNLQKEKENARKELESRRKMRKFNARRRKIAGSNRELNQPSCLRQEVKSIPVLIIRQKFRTSVLVGQRFFHEIHLAG